MSTERINRKPSSRGMHLLCYFIPGLLLFCAGCESAIKGREMKRLLDAIAPQIIITRPIEGSYCQDIVEVEGRAIDYCDENGNPGEIAKLSYKIDSTDMADNIPMENDGSFLFRFSTDTLPAAFSVHIIATDWHNNMTPWILNLNREEDNDIPSFKAAADNRQITVSWEPVPDVESYTLYYTINGGQPAPEYGRCLENVLSPCTINLGEKEFNGMLYTLRLKARVKEDSREYWSSTVKAIPLSEQTLAPRLSGGYKEITVEWDDIRGANGYRVYRSTEKKGEYQDVSGIIESGSFIDKSVEDDITYYYRIAPALPGSMMSSAAAGQTIPISAPYYVWSFDTVKDAVDVAVKGDYAFALDEDDNNPALIVVNITDLYSLSVGASCPISGEPESIHITENFAFVIYTDSTGQGIDIIEISDPLFPYKLISIRNYRTIKDLAAAGNILCLAAGEEGLIIMDISDMENPNEIAHYKTVGNATGVCVRGNYGYLVTSTGLYTFNLSGAESPAAIPWKSIIPESIVPAEIRPYYALLTFNPLDILISGDYLYLSGTASAFIYTGGGMAIIRITDNTADVNTPPELSGTGFYNTGDSVADVFTVSGDYLYLSVKPISGREFGFSTILMLDIADRVSPRLVISCTAPGDSSRGCVIRNFTIQEQYLYIAFGKLGLNILNINSARTPVAYQEVSLDESQDGYAEKIAVEGDYAYVVNNSVTGANLKIYDITNPLSPWNCASTANLKAPVTDLAARGDYLFLLTGDAGLAVVDVTDPRLPVTVEIPWSQVCTTCTAGDIAVAVALKGENAFIVFGQGEFLQLNISHPAEPFRVFSCNLGDDACDLEILGKYANIGCRNKGLRLVDLEKQTCVSGIFIPGWEACITHITLNKTYGYLLDDYANLYFINTSEPRSPVVISSFDVPEEMAINAMKIYGDFIAIASSPGSDNSCLTLSFTPSLFFTLHSEGQALDVAVKGRYAFVANGSKGFLCTNMSPENR